MSDFKADTRDIDRYVRDLAQLNRRGIPYAIKGTLDSLAFDARKKWQGQIRNKMTLRNQFTERSIRVDKSSTRNLESVVGSVADYMETQEEGGTLGPKKGDNKAIPVDSARIGKAHKRLVSRPNKMSNIQLGARKGSSQRQRNAIQIRQAKASGRKFVFLETGGRRGIFKLKGGKRSTKLELVQTLSHRRVRVPPSPTMKPSVHQALKGTGTHYIKNLKFQLQKARTWKR